LFFSIVNLIFFAVRYLTVNKVGLYKPQGGTKLSYTKVL